MIEITDLSSLLNRDVEVNEISLMVLHILLISWYIYSNVSFFAMCSYW